MNVMIEMGLRAGAVGAGATLVMDGWAAVLRRLGIPSLDLGHLGRWIGHFAHGQWAHASIAKAPPVRGERAIGWTAHYLIGVTFASILLAAAGRSWATSPTLLPALAVGVGTVVAPLFVLQPAMGAGIASSKTARPVFNALKSVATHTVFGLGMYAAARLVAFLVDGKAVAS